MLVVVDGSLYVMGLHVPESGFETLLLPEDELFVVTFILLSLLANTSIDIINIVNIMK